jgi:hypothetical protein
MNKSDMKEKLRLAVEEINRKYANLQGIFLYGSFIGDDLAPQDIDILPVLKTCESKRENPWLRGEELIRDYFSKYFPDFPEPRVVSKDGLNGRTEYCWIQNILHAGNGVVYLNEPRQLNQKVKEVRTGLEHFIGTEKATLCISVILNQNY